MRGKDHWRLVGILPKGLRGRHDVDFDAVIPSLGHEAGRALQFKQCFWFSTYRIHHRAAERFRDGRCFVLGDAAHIHSPMGAQGMNTGLQDAYNLAWKLALVAQGRADAALLDTYAEERIPVARRLLATTDTAFRAMVSDSWIAGLWRTAIVARIIAFAMRRRSIQRFAFRVVSQTGIHYRSGSLARSIDGMAADAPQAGDRFPWLKLKLDGGDAVEDLYRKLDDRRFNLVVVGQAVPHGEFGLGDLLGVYLVTDDPQNAAELNRAHVPRPSFYLLRPDGHVGLCGGRLQAGAIERYVRERLRLRPTAAGV
jgi:hypothetical protein